MAKLSKAKAKLHKARLRAEADLKTARAAAERRVARIQADLKVTEAKINARLTKALMKGDPDWTTQAAPRQARGVLKVRNG